MTGLNKSLIPNYIAGLAIIFVFLGGFAYTLFNLDTMTEMIVVEGDESGSAIRGGIAMSIVTAMIFIVKEVSSYFFRKNPSEPTP